MKINNYPAHTTADNLAKQARKIKRLALSSKIVWVGKIMPSDRERLLMGLNKEA